MPRSKVNPFGAENTVAVAEAEEQPITADSTQEPAKTIAVPVSEFAQLIAMFAEKMNEGIERSVRAARELPIDPVKEAQKARAAKSKKEAEESHWSQIKHKALSCSHRRDDLTSAVAWMQCSDKVTRGCCQRCNTCFSPRPEENALPEIYEMYKELIRIPTQKGNSVLYLD